MNPQNYWKLQKRIWSMQLIPDLFSSENSILYGSLYETTLAQTRFWETMNVSNLKTPVDFYFTDSCHPFNYSTTYVPHMSTMIFLHPHCPYKTVSFPTQSHLQCHIPLTLVSFQCKIRSFNSSVWWIN